MRIGIVPGSFKPYHIGHDGLVAIASKENDKVKMFVSLSDRIKPGQFPLLGERMRMVWDRYLRPAIEATYPNVDVIYAINPPLAYVYDELTKADGGEDEYTIYSDSKDIKRYTDKSLSNAAPQLFSRGMITRRGVNRSETVDVSGTYMRHLLMTGETEKFKRLLPNSVKDDAQEILDILRGTSMNESLLRMYVRSILRG